ncbi:MAG: hypothetical protein A2X40_04555 [Elusimicrobia bacterium GWC2_65_9]|nr:MAG: hypothetical protein A2X37_08955 [Elusimicrobia bacterium GWA2_66_18]OGR68855.1 MAG: hypothetical protein A2X40_04555 [Elusimicrobia bacterium GWC2_65_9]
MSFAFPAALWALPAAGLPVLVHLLSRRAARARTFSDLTLLAAVEARSRPRSRLREALLLAARCLLLAALVLAAAGPTARGSSAAAAGEGLDLVLLLDASYSMRALDAGAARFERARAAGLSILKRLSAGDRVAAGVFDESLRDPLAWTDAEGAGRALARATAGLRGTDAAAALAAARGLLERSARGRRRAVVVLGDGAAHMLPAPAPAPAEGTAVLGLRFPPLANAWLMEVRPASGSSAREPRLEVRACAAGPAAAAALDLWVGERRAASTTLAVPAGGEARAVLALPPSADPRRPAWAGRVCTRADALPDDDQVFYAVRHRAAPRVLVLRCDASFERAGRSGWFLRGLFGGAERSLAGRDADFLEASRWSEADLVRYGTILLPDAERLPPGLARALEGFAARGGGVWVVPGPRATPEDLAELSAWLPARFGVLEESASPRGLKILRSGPETSGWDEFELSRVAFARRFRLEPAPGAAAWLADSGGAAMLVAGSVGRGRAAVWAAPLGVDGGNLGLKPLFVPWAKACLSLTLPPDESEASSRSARVGASLVRTWRADEPAPDRVSVRGPDGRRTSLPVRGRRAQLPSADRPGLYEFEEPGGQRSVFAVNLDSSRGESDLAAAPAPPWISVEPDALEEAFFVAAYGRDRRGLFLGLAALALALEMLLSLPRARSSASVLVLLLSIHMVIPGRALAQQGDRFVWTQLELGRTWDPYPDAPEQAAARLAEVTSARVAPGRRVLTLDDQALFASPFLYLAGREEPPELTDAELRRLRQFFSGGGLLWVEDSTGGPPGSFDRWVRRTLPRILPETELRPLPSDHVLYRAFFLLRGPAGRVRVHAAVEGVAWGGRAAVLYTRDDALGAWAKDALGRSLKACVPGGEPQREQAKRLTLNLLMYSMTGSYKADAVHQSAILDKLRNGP